MYHKRLKTGFTPFGRPELVSGFSTHGSYRKSVYKLRSFPNVLIGNVKTLLINNTSPIKTLRDDKSGYVGFTLIELLVVVLIIGILAAISLPQYQWSVEKVRAAEAFSVLKILKNAQESYYLANGQYASSIDQLDLSIPTSQFYEYVLTSYNVKAIDKKNHYVLAIRLSYPLGGYTPDLQLCGFSFENNENEAKAYCKHLGADVSVKESDNTWIIYN